MNYDVILNANDSATLETQYAFTQGDYGQIQFSIRVKADGQYVTNALRAYIVFTLSNGMIVTGADMPKSVATYTYVFQGNELQSPGKVVADVKLVYANGQVSSNKFAFICRFDPLADKSVPAAPYITVLQQIVDEGKEKIDYLQALIDSIQGGIGATALTRNDLQNTRNPVSAGAKAIDAQMAQYLLLKGDLVNNGLTTVEGFALDARYGKNLQDQITATNSNLALKANTSDLENLYTKSISIYGYKDLVALPPGIYVYNGWSYTSYTGVVPFTNAMGTWIRTKYSDDLGTDTVIKEDGTIYMRKIVSGTWGAWTSK